MDSQLNIAKPSYELFGAGPGDDASAFQTSLTDRQPVTGLAAGEYESKLKGLTSLIYSSTCRHSADKMGSNFWTAWVPVLLSIHDRHELFRLNHLRG